MTEVQKGALEAGASGSDGQPSPETPAPITDAAPAGESAEETLARLTRERDEAQESAKREKELRLSHQEKVEKANQVLAREAAQPITPPPGMADPLDQNIVAIENEIRAAQATLGNYTEEDVAKYPELRALRLSAINTAATLNGLYGQRQTRDRDRILTQSEPAFAAMPEKHRAKAREIFRQNRAATPQDALLLARAEGSPDDLDERLAEAEKARQQAERDLAARKESVAPGSPRPVLGLQRPAANGVLTIKRSQLRKMDGLPPNHPDAIAYNTAYRAGHVKVEED